MAEILKKEKYVFREYNPKFKSQFQTEKKKLRNILVRKAEIEHIGSTAVKGLGGKGIIDIIIAAPRKKLKQVKKKLEKNGYEYCHESLRKNRLYFKRYLKYKDVKREIHVHLTYANSQMWKDSLAFRNYLIENPKEAKEYYKIKKEAVKKSKGSGYKYRKFKNNFIKKIKRRIIKNG